MAVRHTAFDVIKYFNDREIEVLPWPAKSPDLNLIEEVWSHLKSKLKGSYNTTNELEEDVRECWENTPLNFIQNLYTSMPRRIQAIIETDGDPQNIDSIYYIYTKLLIVSRF